MLAKTPEPPYFAAIFSSVRTEIDEGYYAMNDALFEALSEMPGYLGHESAREEVGITVSYWSDLEALRNWKELPLHKKAQQLGREKWYQAYKVRICKVERDYSFEASTDISGKVYIASPISYLLSHNSSFITHHSSLLTFSSASPGFDSAQPPDHSITKSHISYPIS